MLLHKYRNDDFSKINTKLLVTCPNDSNSTGGLFYLDFESNICKKIFEADSRGIDYFNNMFYLATESHGVIVFDTNFFINRIFKMPLYDVHGIKISNNLVYIVETLNDTVGIYDLNRFQKLSEINLFSYSNDQSHINDILIENNSLYISMFSLSGKWKQLTNNFDGAILEYDILNKRLKKTIKKNLQLPHSLIKVNNSIHYCESLGLNLSNQSTELAKFFGYTRGLAFDGRYFYIGQSEMRHLNRVLSVHKNISIDCGLYILDSLTHVFRFLPLPANQIYQIQIVDKLNCLPLSFLDFKLPNYIRSINRNNWHNVENNYSWSKCKSAKFKLFRPLGRNKLILKLKTSYPDKYAVSIDINNKILKKIVFKSPKIYKAVFSITNITDKILTVNIKVSFLWKANNYFKNDDRRKLGIALKKAYFK